jgi:hypothetical protein
MGLNSEQKELLELFVKQELLIEKLYKRFSERYPDYKRFWTKLAYEEYQHALIIQRLSENLSINSILFSQGNLRTTNLNSSINYIENLIIDFTNNKSDFPIARSATIALQLEKGLWENKIFQCFEGDSEEVRRVLSSLHLEQEVHIRKIQKFALKFMGLARTDTQNIKTTT